MKAFALLLCLLFCHSALSKPVLNVYNWADYMPASVIKKFERETGIQINYTEYDSNEMLYAKLKSNPKLGYDIIFPSSYYVDRMSREHMLLPLDRSKLTQFGNLNPVLLNQSFDPNNVHSVPYLWGTTAIVVNTKYIDPATITSWNAFWRPQFKNQLLLFDDMREVFAIALFRLGYSINDTNPKHIEEAYQQLKKLWPNVKLFSIEAEANVYIDEDANIGMGLSGEVYNAIAENANLTYIYPQEGFELWMDCIAIPINAPNQEGAIKFINFLLRPDIASAITMYTGFSTPNRSALSLLPTAIKTSLIVNPDNDVLKRSQYLRDLGEVNAVYELYWNKLKIGE